MILASHLTGNSNVRDGLGFLAASGQLSEFHTGLSQDSFRWLPRRLRRRALSRQLPPALAAVARLHPEVEIPRLMARSINVAALQSKYSVDWAMERIDRAAAQSLSASSSHFDAVYAFEDSAYHTFRAAKALGVPRFYDLPIGYWESGRTILEEEAELRPEWRSTMRGLSDPPEKLRRKTEELELADLVVVASTFTERTLRDSGYLGKVKVVPYGGPPRSELRRPPEEATHPLKLLYVGNLTQRKGLSYLFESVRELGSDVQLTLVGSNPDSSNLTLRSEMANHTWHPWLSRRDVLRLMSESDVLVFPSLFEGFGLVLTEAMSVGLPFIATDHTAAPDLLSAHPGSGWTVPIRDSLAIIQQVRQLLDQPDLLNEASHLAYSAAERPAWGDYGSRLASVVREQFN